PVLLGGGQGDAQRRRLLGGEAGEEAELDQVGLARVLRLQLPEGLVQGEQFVVDQRQELLAGVYVAFFDRRQDAGDVAHEGRITARKEPGKDGQRRVRMT